MSHILSKSSFVTGLQCSKKLYFQKRRRDLIPEMSMSQELIFNQGTQVGVLAHQRFPGGKDATPNPYYDFDAAISKTKQWMEEGVAVIYEATFRYDEILVMVDVLVRDGDAWKAFEVKSSTEVKEVNINDAAIQYYVLHHAGVSLNDISIVHINNKYVYNGMLDVNEFFKAVSVLDVVVEKQHSIPALVAEFKGVLNEAAPPEIEIGKHCDTPYSCEFKHHCWAHLPEYSIFDISNLSAKKKWELFEQGVRHLDEIPSDYELGNHQWMQVNSALNNTKVIKREKIAEFTEGLNYPLYFLDFETFMTAVPQFEGTRPYQPLVFQYSLHVQAGPGEEVLHKEYLADPKAKFLEDLVQVLISDCGSEGDIVVYNQSFEKGKIAALAKLFPAHAEALNKINERIVDLMLPFQQRWYYTPEMRGSYSIKYVLPALVNSANYDALAIKEGGTASALFSQMMLGLFNGDEKTVREDLLAYCKLDTYAMVLLLQKLRELAERVE